jgi:hypothetical protein
MKEDVRGNKPVSIVYIMSGAVSQWPQTITVVLLILEYPRPEWGETEAIIVLVVSILLITHLK